MLIRSVPFKKYLEPVCFRYPSYRLFRVKPDTTYSKEQQEIILKVINESDIEVLSGYNVAKTKLKKLFSWKKNSGSIKNLTDLELIDGWSLTSARRLFSSILKGPPKQSQILHKIKGPIIQPFLSETTKENSKSVLAFYTRANYVSWCLFNKINYEILEWQHMEIEHHTQGKGSISDMLEKAWRITRKLPNADLYIMRDEVMNLRSSGSNSKNPKMIPVNLQNAQMIAMIICLLNNKNSSLCVSANCDNPEEDMLQHKVYFLKSMLPYRLFGTLVGTEVVSVERPIELILKNSKPTDDNSIVYIPEELIFRYYSRSELDKEILGHSLLLGVTFMDLCIYNNYESVNKLLNRNVTES